MTHTTKYAYSEPVPVCHNKLHLAPRTHFNQRCSDFRLLVIPEPAAIVSSHDYFGNRTDYFSLTDAHRGLSVTASSSMEVIDTGELLAMHVDTSWEAVQSATASLHSDDALELQLLTFASDYIPVGEAYADYARPSFAADRAIVDAITDLTRRIHEEFDYDPRTTNVSTPVEQVLAQKSGVCQDFAHFQIACLRSVGLAARYVSGYLRTVPPAGKPRLVGADASHAWLSVYCGEVGWIDFDPTNNTICGTDYITIAHGRDYGDVCPIQGVFLGGGDHSMSVYVDVEAIETEK
ncbi:MAG: transglutaminase family protein [Planctomycetota bacterium]